MKSKKPAKLHVHPQRKLATVNGNKAASAKKASCKDNRRLAITHSKFRVRSPKTKRVYTVFLALCAEEQKPWKNLNFGEMIDKHSFRDWIQHLEQLDDI